MRSDRLGPDRYTGDSSDQIHIDKPETSPQLIVGLPYLQHTFDLFAEEVVWPWMKNPYQQTLTGEMYLQTELPHRA